jgi:polysaccharide export outer membrane protein
MVRTHRLLHLSGRLLAVALCAMLVAGCVARPRVVGAAAQDTPQPIPGQEAPENYEYRLGPGDRISVKVFGQGDVSGEFEIAGDGKISMPLIGQVNAANLTINEFRDSVARMLDEKFLVEPKVSVEVTNYRPFYILGQVNNPGNYPYKNGINMRQAIALAGGYTRRAAEEPMIVDRRDEVGNLLRYWATQDTPVLPGDTITVRRRMF